MKRSILKNKLVIFTLVLMGIFFVDVKGVEAGELNWDEVSVECIYDDGGAYTYSQKYDVTNRVAYKLVGVDSAASATSAGDMYLNPPIDSNHKCLPGVTYADVKADDDDVNPITYYHFDTTNPTYTFTANDFAKAKVGENWWKAFWSSAKMPSTIAKEANGAEVKKKAYLVSERYILTDKAGDPDWILTYRQGSDQAAGSDSYLYIMKYGSVYLLKTNDKVTMLDGATNHFSNVNINSSSEIEGLGDEDKIYINSPEASSVVDSSMVSSYSYNSGQVRYNVSTTPSGNNTREFALFNSVLDPDSIDNGELCDAIMPETSKVLKQIIQISRYLVPVLMIILCALDICKIVMSGNIEEDMPKQRKKILARMIIGAVFFFLPLIVSLVIDNMVSSGMTEAEDIASIKCLFE